MKNQITKIALLCSMSLLVACDDGLYTVDENADKAPIVTIRGADDELAGTRDVLMRDSTGLDTSLNANEGTAMIYPWDNVSTVYPSNYPYIRFNKLLDGSTIEQTQVDTLSKKELGNCAPVPGAIEVYEDDVLVPYLRTCYSPSDKLVGVQITEAPEDGAPVGTPKLFLKYNTTYSYRLTANIKDKKGASLEPFRADVLVSGFALLSITDASMTQQLYAQDTGNFAALVPEAAEVDSPVQQLRFLFSGPMLGDVAKEGLTNVKLYDANDVEITATKVDTNEILSSVVAQNEDGHDLREVLLTVPQALVDPKAGALPPGEYKLVFPVTVTDNGEVMGTAQDPVAVPLAEEIVVPFTVLPPEEE